MWISCAFQVALPQEDDVLSSQESDEDLARMLTKVQLTEREISMNQGDISCIKPTKVSINSEDSSSYAQSVAPDRSWAGSSSGAGSSGAGTSGEGSGESSSIGSARGGDGSHPTLVDFLSENMQVRT